MPVMRTVTRKDGSTYEVQVTNRHPDGTEFLPEEFTLPYNEQTKAFYRLHYKLALEAFEKKLLEEERAKNSSK